MDVALRRAAADDLDHIRWALYTALAWNPDRELPPPEVTLEHPRAAIFHRDWGRIGDAGLIATAGTDVVGVAYYRLFNDEEHGSGYIDSETPELVVAVRDDHRGLGLGARLLNELARTARESGFTRLSLDVLPENPARRLYERLGYRELSANEDGVLMVLELDSIA